MVIHAKGGKSGNSNRCNTCNTLRRGKNGSTGVCLFKDHTCVSTASLLHIYVLAAVDPHVAHLLCRSREDVSDVQINCS